MQNRDDLIREGEPSPRDTARNYIFLRDAVLGDGNPRFQSTVYPDGEVEVPPPPAESSEKNNDQSEPHGPTKKLNTPKTKRGRVGSTDLLADAMRNYDPEAPENAKIEKMRAQQMRALSQDEIEERQRAQAHLMVNASPANEHQPNGVDTYEVLEDVDVGVAIFREALNALAAECGVPDRVVEEVGVTAYRNSTEFRRLVLAPVIQTCLLRHGLDPAEDSPEEIIDTILGKGIEVGCDDVSSTPATFPILEFFEKTRDRFLDNEAYKRLTNDQKLRVWQMLALASRRKREHHCPRRAGDPPVSGFAHFLSSADAQWWLTGVLAPDVCELIVEN